MKAVLISLIAPLTLSLALSACQSQPADDAAIRFDRDLAAGRLDEAAGDLAALDEAGQVEQRKRLARAYLSLSQASLARGDIDAASNALTRARQLMPDAPALAADFGDLMPAPADGQAAPTP